MKVDGKEGCLVACCRVKVTLRIERQDTLHNVHRDFCQYDPLP